MTPMNALEGKRVAILATDGFEQSELEKPLDAFRTAGAEVHVISPKGDSIRGWKDGNWGDEVPVDYTLDQADPSDYDSLMLPGGVMNPDKLRMNDKALDFVRAFFEAAKPVSAICHGPQILIDCGVLEGRAVTSYPSIKQDLKNASARWSDQVVVVDHGLTTSRTPADLSAFISKAIEETVEGLHTAQATA